MSKPEFVAPLSHEDVMSLGSDTVTKKKYDSLISQINNRFDYVFRTAMSLMGRSVQWYDYDNLGEDSDGYFSLDYYPEDIEVTGKFQTPSDTLYPYHIPTHWLWTDFESDLKSEISQHKKDLSEKRKSLKEKKMVDAENKKQAIASIRKKLTKKELSYISFK